MDVTYSVLYVNVVYAIRTAVSLLFYIKKIINMFGWGFFFF